MNFSQRINSAAQWVKEPFRDKNRLDPQKLGKHVRKTYLNIRIAAAVIAVIFPILLLAGGHFFVEPPITLLGSMSAYYHTDLGAIFVGVLLFVGTILFLYQGYTDLENRALDLAGVLACCVALFPTAAPEGVETFTAPTLHGISAILFFLCIAYVCLWRYRDTLDFVQDEGRKRWYRWIYRTLATLMVVLPLLAAALLGILGQSTVVFWVEAFAVWVFAAYWIVKSREVTESLSGVPAASVSYFLGAQR